MTGIEGLKHKIQEQIEEYQKEMYLAISDDSHNIFYYEGAIDSLNWVLENLKSNNPEEPIEAWGDY